MTGAVAPEGRMHGKTVLVTGGASGIGFASAKLLAAEGAEVLILDVDEPAAERSAAEIGPQAQRISIDIAQPDAWAQVAERVESLWGRLDALVHSAGIAFAKPAGSISVEEWRRVMGVNLDGVFFGTQSLLPLLRKSVSPAIVVIASSSGLRGKAKLSAYCASKGGVRLLAAALAVELAAEDPPIRCNTIFPGTIDTALSRGSLGISPDDPNGAAQILARVTGIPLSRLGSAEEVAAAVLFLASDEAAYVTGAELSVDGGRTA